MTAVWLNGRLLAAADAHIDIADRGFLLADGLFETMLAREGAIEHLDAHLARLAEGAAVLGIPIPFDARVLGEACIRGPRRERPRYVVAREPAPDLDPRPRPPRRAAAEDT